MKEERLRRFEVSSLNFNAKEYYNIINWEKCDITELSLTKAVSIEDFTTFVEEYQEGDEPLFKFPAHTQAIERKVKLVTHTSAKVCGQRQRNRRILIVISRRKEQPKFRTRQPKIELQTIVKKKRFQVFFCLCLELLFFKQHEFNLKCMLIVQEQKMIFVYKLVALL